MGVGIEFLPLQVDNFDELSIQQLLELCLSEKSTEAAWCEFVRRTQKVISGTVYKKVLNRQMRATKERVEDLTQKTYLNLFKNNSKRLRAFKPKCENSLFSYLKAAAKNAVIDDWRDCKRRQEEPWDDNIDPPAPDPKPLRKVQIEEIWDYLTQKFSEQECDIFRLFHIHDFTAKAISELPGINRTENQVEYVLWRAMRALKDKFGGSDGLPFSDDN